MERKEINWTLTNNAWRNTAQAKKNLKEILTNWFYKWNHVHKFNDDLTEIVVYNSDWSINRTSNQILAYMCNWYKLSLFDKWESLLIIDEIKLNFFNVEDWYNDQYKKRNELLLTILHSISELNLIMSTKFVKKFFEIYIYDQLNILVNLVNYLAENKRVSVEFCNFLKDPKKDLFNIIKIVRGEIHNNEAINYIIKNCL